MMMMMVMDGKQSFYLPLQVGSVPVHILFRSQRRTESPISMYP